MAIHALTFFSNLKFHFIQLQLYCQKTQSFHFLCRSGYFIRSCYLFSWSITFRSYIEPKSLLHPTEQPGHSFVNNFFKENFNIIRSSSPLCLMYVVGPESFRPDIQKPRQIENAVRDI
jgi:hypothetical protein